MTRARLTLFTTAAVLAGGLLLAAGSNPEPRQVIRGEIPSMMPPNANLYLGFADLRGDLERLGASEAWNAFLAGPNHEEFVRSRLWLRFQDRLAQLEALVGGTLDGPSLQRMAASTCGLAFYAIGDIEFVYVARADAEAELTAALVDLDGRFETTQHGGVDVHVARDMALGLELAWARAGGYLVVSDRLRLLETTLDLVAGSGPSLADDPAFQRALDGLPPDGTQLAFLNLANLRDDAYFKSYWMQKDRAVLEQADAFGATVAWGDDGITEHRMLVQDVPGGPEAVAADPLDALVAMPADALVIKSAAAAEPGEAAAVFLDGGRGQGSPVDGFRTPLHDLLEAGALSRDEFDALVGDRFAVAVLARSVEPRMPVLDRVVVTRPTDAETAERLLETMRRELPPLVTARLAGDVERPFPMTSVLVEGTDLWSFDLVTRGIYGPALALRDGWLIQASNAASARAVIEALARGRSAAGRADSAALAGQVEEGSVRQVLLVDLAAVRTTYGQIVDAMERGDTFRSWEAREFWGTRVRDLLHVLSAVDGVSAWSSRTDEGLVGQTVYRIGG